MSVTIRTASLEQYAEGGEGKLRILLFGTPGSGKTPFAAQFPKPIFLLADRGGDASLVLTQTPYIEIRSESDMHDALSWLEKESRRPSFEYETVVIDTYSVLQAHIIQGMLRKQNLDDIDGFEAWGALSAAMKKILDRAHRLPMHLIVNVHLKDKFKADAFEPDLVGSAKIDLPKEFPFIGLIHTDWGIEEGGSEGEETTPSAARTVVRKIAWKATPRMPLLRSASGILPAETPVEFSPRDYEIIRDYISKGSGASKAKATAVEVVPDAAPPVPADVPGGPVVPKAAGPTKAVAPAKAPAKKAAAKKAEPALEAEPTLEEAVSTAAEVLGAEVVSEESDPLLTGIFGCTTIDALKNYYLANKSDPKWTSEHTKHVTDVKASLLA